MFYTDLIVIVGAMLSRAFYVRANEVWFKCRQHLPARGGRREQQPRVKNGFQVHVDSLRANHEGVGPDRAMEVLSEHRPANLVTST